MTCKFSKPSLIERFTLDRAALVLLFGVAASAGSIRAQQPTPGKEPKAYIRFWNMLPDKPINDLLVLAGEKPLFGAAPLDLYNDYVPSPVGNYNLVVKRAEENGAVLMRAPVALPDKMFITVLATEKNGQPTLEILNDTPDPKVTELTAQLTVRSFFLGGSVAVGITGGRPPMPVAGGATVDVDNIPMTAGASIVIQVSTPAATPNSPPTTKIWNLPADFSVTHHATLLLVPDHYGRLRPKLFYNGRLAYPGAAPQGEKH